MATTPIPQPPDVTVQGAPAPAGPSINRAPGGEAGMAANGPSQNQMMMQMQSKVEEFEKITAELFQLLSMADPQAQALFVPVAQGGAAIKQRVAQMIERGQQGPAAPAQASPSSQPAEAAPGPAAAPQMQAAA